MKKILPKTPANTQGFTLIELLVVIAILAILATIGMAVFTSVQSKGRDAKRRSDVREITKALDVAKGADSTTFPALVDTLFTTGSIPKDPSPASQTYCIAWALSTAGTLPTDPTAVAVGGTPSCTGPAASNGVYTAWTPLSNGSILGANVAYKVRVCSYLEDAAASPRMICSTTQAN